MTTDNQPTTQPPDTGIQTEQEPEGRHCDGNTFDDCESCAKGWCGFPDQHCEHRDPLDDDDDGGNDWCTHCGCCPCNSCMYARFA